MENVRRLYILPKKHGWKKVFTMENCWPHFLTRTSKLQRGMRRRNFVRFMNNRGGYVSSKFAGRFAGALGWLEFGLDVGLATVCGFIIGREAADEPGLICGMTSTVFLIALQANLHAEV